MKNNYKELKLNYLSIIGVDEVGRGCLAGPVTASAVFVKKEDIGKIRGINDSKKVSKKQRLILYNEIIKTHIYATVFIDSNNIDKINIHNASLLAMKEAILKLKKKSEVVIVDGLFEIPGLSLKQQAYKKADENFYTVAAASIVAKVERDELMSELSIKYTNYSFSAHKGYGTKAHKNEIRKFGILKIHRKSFKLN